MASKLGNDSAVLKSQFFDRKLLIINRLKLVACRLFIVEYQYLTIFYSIMIFFTSNAFNDF